MGIGYQAFAIFDEILNKKLLKKCESVLETGSQSLIYQERAKDLLQKHEKKIINSNLDAKNFYFQIGFKNYKSIDADGGFGAIPYDLNQNLREKYNFNEQFDLVTNFGTSEHVFNQKVFFENVHNLTSRNGYMLHILPFEGHINHGYFNYNPVLFYELAIFNNYEIIDFWYFSEKPNARFKYYGHSFKPFKYNNGLIEELEKLCKKNLIQNTMKTNFSELAILYKKKTDDEFKQPFQGEWLHQSKLENYKTNLNMQNVKKILETNKNIDNKKQINDILGNGYWKIKIINMIKNPKLIIKNFKLFLNLIGFNFKFKDKFWDQ